MTQINLVHCFSGLSGFFSVGEKNSMFSFRRMIQSPVLSRWTFTHSSQNFFRWNLCNNFCPVVLL